MCHMLSTDLDALHALAKRLGLKPVWFQDKWGSAPHYDLCKAKRAAALKLGAIEADRHKTVELFRYWRDRRANWVNVGRTGNHVAFSGLFGNPVREKEVSSQYRTHFKKLMERHPEEIKWLRQQIAEGAQLFCPGCGFDCSTCHARIIEQEIAFS